MTWKDKLEIGLKEDAPFRIDNLPEFQVRGPEIPAGSGRSSEIPESRTDPTAPDAAPGSAATVPRTKPDAPHAEADKGGS